MGATIFCPFPSALYKPQFAYPTPKGYRDETYLVPFRFLVPADGKLHLEFPWQLDDDVPFIIRGIVFPKLGTANPLYNQIPQLAFPGFCRIRDTQGNALSYEPVLALGVWAQSGFADENTPTGINAFGFPIEPQVPCTAGGVVSFDFQINTDAVPASLTDTVGAGELLFVARIYGTAGNAYTVALIDPGAPSVPISVLVVGTAVQVTLATDGASAIISTLADVAAAVNGSASAVALVGALVSGDSSQVVVDMVPTALSGGSAASGNPVALTGTLIGVKRFKDC